MVLYRRLLFKTAKYKAHTGQIMPKRYDIFRITARIPHPTPEYSSVTNRHTNWVTIKNKQTNERKNKVQQRPTQSVSRTADSLYESCAI